MRQDDASKRPDNVTGTASAMSPPQHRSVTDLVYGGNADAGQRNRHQGDAMSIFLIVIAWLFGLGAIQTDTQTGTNAGCPPRDYAVPDTAHSYGL